MIARRKLRDVELRMKRLESPQIVKAWFTLTTSRERVLVLAVLSVFLMGIIARHAHLRKECADYQTGELSESKEVIDCE